MATRGFSTFVLILAALDAVSCLNLTLDVLYEWGPIEFVYSAAKKKRDMKSGVYVPEDIIILGAGIFTDADNKRTVFVTTPDLIPGSPFTLSTVTDKRAPSGGYFLQPFPNERAHYRTTKNCKSIVNVWRVQIDPFGRLWVIDTGKFNTLIVPEFVCPPKILIYDLKNKNKLIRTFTVQGVNPLSVLANVLFHIPSPDDPSSIIALLNDEIGANLIVYNYKKDSSFTIDHPFFHIDPYNFSFFDFGGAQFYKPIGIDGIALSPLKGKSDRTMYFHPLASGTEFSVPLSTVLDPTKNGVYKYLFDYKIIGNRTFHSSVITILEEGTMLLTNVEDYSIMAWDTSTPYDPEKFTTLVKDNKRLQFIPTLKVMTASDGSRTVLITSNRIQNSVVGKPKRNEINSRIFLGKLTT